MLMQSIFDQAARFRILALGNGSPESESASEHISKDRLIVEQLKNFAEPGTSWLQLAPLATHNVSCELWNMAHPSGVERLPLPVRMAAR